MSRIFKCRLRNGEVEDYVQNGHRINKLGHSEDSLDSEELTELNDKSVAIEYIDEIGQVIANGREGLEKVIKALEEEGGVIR